MLFYEILTLCDATARKLIESFCAFYIIRFARSTGRDWTRLGAERVESLDIHQLVQLSRSVGKRLPADVEPRIADPSSRRHLPPGRRRLCLDPATRGEDEAGSRGDGCGDLGEGRK